MISVFQYRELAAFLNFMIETLWFSMYMLNSVVNAFNFECIAKFCAWCAHVIPWGWHCLLQWTLLVFFVVFFFKSKSISSKYCMATSRWHALLVYSGCCHAKMWTDQHQYMYMSDVFSLIIHDRNSVILPMPCFLYLSCYWCHPSFNARMLINQTRPVLSFTESWGWDICLWLSLCPTPEFLHCDRMI